jgi:endogenous inhibitor of DNA gyrase (YacG/DUF329 family)
VELLIDERGTTPEKLVVSCPNCGGKIQGSPQSAREIAGLSKSCPKCSTPVRMPAEPAIHAAFQRAAERHATEERRTAEFRAAVDRSIVEARSRAGHSAGRAAGLTAGVREGEGIVGSVAGQAVNASPATSSIVSPEPEPEPATPGQAPAVTPDAWSRSTPTSDGGPADRPAAGTPEPAPVEPGPADDARGLELLIDELRQRDAGYTVPERIDRAIVATWTGGRVA